MNGSFLLQRSRSLARVLNRRAVGAGLASLACATALGKARSKGGDQELNAATGDNLRAFDPFLVFYGGRIQSETDRYSLIILEDHEVGKFLIKRQPSATLLSYLSLAEVHSGRPYFNSLASEGLLGAANPNWPDARFVDLRSDGWQRRVLREIIPAIIDKGYRGVFIDTLDSVEYLETQRPDRFGGMIAAAADLVRSIRASFPSILIMINRGYAVLPGIVGQFDMLLGESVRTTFDSELKSYRRMSEPDLHWQRKRMLEAQTRDPAVRLFSLDYWDPDDKLELSKLYAEGRADGFIPYVATPDLTRIVPEP